jgi:RHS repeat-associated protein
MKKLIISALLFAIAFLANSLHAQEPTMEFGRVSLNHKWLTINFTKSYINPIVVAGPPTRNGGHPSVVRIQNVTATSFQIRIQEWDYLDQWHMFENVSYIVVEKGRHNMPNGTVLEAGSIDLLNSTLKTKNFLNAIPTLPAVFASVATFNDPSAVTQRLKDVNQNSFRAKMQEEEANDGIHASETLNFIAMEKVAGTIGGFEYLVGTEMVNHKVSTLTSLGGYQNFFANMQTLNGGDTASVRMTGTPEEVINFYIEEEKSEDNEMRHLHEEVAYLIFRPIVIAPPITYTLTFTAGDHGSLSGNTSQTINSGSNSTPITAIADSGYLFDKWSDNDTSNPRTISNVTASYNLTAIFKAEVIVNPPVAGVILDQVFEHSNFNRRDTVTYANGSSWSYLYGDGLGNLTSATKVVDPNNNATNLTFTYSYDDIGNRLTSAEMGVNKVYTPNELNQYDQIDIDGLVVTIEYDHDGNPTSNGDWDLFWDAEDRLKSMSHKTNDMQIAFTYDYRGFRVKKSVTVNGQLEKNIGFLYDGNLVTAEIDLLDPNKTIIRNYTWGLDPAGTTQEVGGIGALLETEVVNQDNGSSAYYYSINDAGGNVVNLLEADDNNNLSIVNSYEYGPFGQIIASTETVDNPYRFNTKYTDDETGLVYYGFRYYDAQNGRWLNSDPIGVDGGINTYNSVSNNMVNGFSGGRQFTKGMESSLGRLKTGLGIDAYGNQLYFEDLIDYSLSNGGISAAVREVFKKIVGEDDPYFEESVEMIFHYLYGDGSKFSRQGGSWEKLMHGQTAVRYSTSYFLAREAERYAKKAPQGKHEYTLKFNTNETVFVNETNSVRFVMNGSSQGFSISAKIIIDKQGECSKIQFKDSKFKWKDRADLHGKNNGNKSTVIEGGPLNGVKITDELFAQLRDVITKISLGIVVPKEYDTEIKFGGDSEWYHNGKNDKFILLMDGWMKLKKNNPGIERVPLKDEYFQAGS